MELQYQLRLVLAVLRVEQEHPKTEIAALIRFLEIP